MPFVAKRVFDYEPVAVTPEWGLRDLQVGMAYSLCNSIQCADCGALFLDLRFSDSEMASLYAGYRDEAYTELRERFEPGYRIISTHYAGRAAYLELIEAFLRPLLPPTPMLLDWGGDTGINTLLLSSASVVHIFDISKKPPVSGAHTVDLATARAHRYDLITCSQVLEHVSYPCDLVSELASLMRTDTLLYLEVPFETLMRTHPREKQLPAKRHWHEHVNFFSEESLRALISRSGLDLVELRATDISLGYRDACVFSVVCRLPSDRRNAQTREGC